MARLEIRLSQVQVSTVISGAGFVQCGDWFASCLLGFLSLLCFIFNIFLTFELVLTDVLRIHK